LRFGQILQAFKYVTLNEDKEWNNEFYTEPEEILKRVEKEINEKFND